MTKDQAKQSDEPPEKPTRHALLACAQWLVYCLKIGWHRNDLDRLEEIWWMYHDHRGNPI